MTNQELIDQYMPAFIAIEAYDRGEKSINIKTLSLMLLWSLSIQ